MNAILRVLCLWTLFFGGPQIQAAATNSLRMTLELQDGSRVVGKSGDKKFQFNSTILGELKLPLDQIGSIECQPKTNLVKLIAVNGDQLTVAFDMKEIHLETSFGNVTISVDSIRRLQVSAASLSGRTKMGLVALWSGEGSGVDLVNGNTAESVGEVTFASGKQGRAFHLNGENSYLQIRPNAALNIGLASGLTIEGWIKPATIAQDMLIFEYERELGTANGSDVGMELAIHRFSANGRGMGCLYANLVDVDGAGHIIFSPANILVPGVWQHVALSYDKTTGTAAIYLNGVAVAKSNLGIFTPQTSFANLLLGAKTTYNSATNPGNAYSGDLDEFGIYNRALSAAEIQAICTEENNGEPMPPPTVSSGRVIFNGHGPNFIPE